MDKVEKIKDWLKPYLKKDKVRDEHEEGFFHCAMLLNDFIDTLSEEPDKSLEEAAEEYATEWHQNPDGSAWKPYFEVSTIKAFVAGAEWQKTQMMKESVEGYLNYYEDSGGILMAEAQVGCPYHNGDKVHIIIVKEE